MSNLRKIHGLGKPKTTSVKEKPITDTQQAKAAQTPVVLPKPGRTTTSASTEARAGDRSSASREHSQKIKSKEIIVAACGHEVEFLIFEDAQDRFREKRRLKVLDNPCKECKQAKHQKTMKEQQAAKREKLKTTPKKVYVARWKRNAAENTARLPHGCMFQDVRYDAVRVMWTGKLLVPGFNRYIEFEGEHTAVFGLLALLDSKYREYAKPTKAPETEDKKEMEDVK